MPRDRRRPGIVLTGVLAAAVPQGALAVDGPADAAPTSVLAESAQDDSLQRVARPARAPIGPVLPVYVDRVMTSEPQSVDSREPGTPPSRRGRPRFIDIELLGSSILSTGTTANVITTGPTSTQQPRTINRSRQIETGGIIAGSIDTIDYGALSISATVVKNFSSGTDNFYNPTQAASGITQATIIQRAMPLGNGWHLDSFGGTALPYQVDLARESARIALSSAPILGAGARLTREAPTDTGYRNVLSVNLAAGEPGSTTGLKLNQFRGAGGFSATGGVQAALGEAWQFGAQALVQRNAGDRYAAFYDGGTSDTAQARLDATSGQITASWTVPGIDVHAGFLHSSVTARKSVGPSDAITALTPGVGSANGAWLDATWRSGRFSSAGGVYRFDRGLSWGQDHLVDNAMGVYGRTAYQSQRWQWTGDFDAYRSVSGDRNSNVTLNGNARYRLSSRRSIGGGVIQRFSNSASATSGNVFGQVRSTLGQTTARVDVDRDPLGSGVRLALDQNWTLPSRFGTGTHLLTSLTYGHRVDREVSGPLDPNTVANLVAVPRTDLTGFGGSVSAGFDLANRLNLQGTVSYDHTTSGVARALGQSGIDTVQNGGNLAANVTATYFVSDSLALTTTALRSTGSQYGRTLFGDPLGGSGSSALRQTLESRSRSTVTALFVSLRFHRATGAPPAVLGDIGNRDGSGRLSGRMFLDRNGDGIHDSDEPGVADAQIVLDGRYMARTDAQGRYDFGRVARGEHRIEPSTDALPLPWMLGKTLSAITVDVGVQERTVVDIGATLNP